MIPTGWLVLVTSGVTAGVVSEADLAFFESRVRPVLVEHCLECHGGKKQQGGFSLATRDLLLKGAIRARLLFQESPTRARFGRRSPTPATSRCLQRENCPNQNSRRCGSGLRRVPRGRRILRWWEKHLPRDHVP